jgi:hypothetical protein
MTEQLRRCPGGCGTSIPARVLVCPECWRCLPDALRMAVVATQKERRLAPTDPVAVAEHRAATADARTWLRQHQQPRPRLVTADIERAYEATMVRDEWQRSNCEACRAPIIWATTASKDRVPVDVDPVNPALGSATVKLTDRGPGQPPRAELVRDQRRWFGAQVGWRSHMDTCPYADHYRARARRRAS